jgi:hypothetical protein
MLLWCGARTAKHSYSGQFYDTFLDIEPQTHSKGFGRKVIPIEKSTTALVA